MESETAKQARELSVGSQIHLANDSEAGCQQACAVAEFFPLFLKPTAARHENDERGAPTTKVDDLPQLRFGFGDGIGVLDRSQEQIDDDEVGCRSLLLEIAASCFDLQP